MTDKRRIVVTGEIRKPFGITSRDILLLEIDGEQKDQYCQSNIKGQQYVEHTCR